MTTQQLIDLINDKIKPNGDGEITAALLRDVLLAIVGVLDFGNADGRILVAEDGTVKAKVGATIESGDLYINGTINSRGAAVIEPTGHGTPSLLVMTSADSRRFNIFVDGEGNLRTSIIS